LKNVLFNRTKLLGKTRLIFDLGLLSWQFPFSSKMKKALLSLLCICYVQAILAQVPLELSSPDGQLSLRIDNQQILTYSLVHQGNILLQPSQLGFLLSKPKLDLSEFEIFQSQEKEVNQTWSPLFGEKSSIQDQYRELILSLKTKTQPALEMQLTFRLYNDGLGFRYTFPEQEVLKHFIIEEELTEFKLGADHLAFWIPGDYDTNEFLYQTTRLSDIRALKANAEEIDIAVKHPAGDQVIQSPLQLVTDQGYYLHLHEAALGNYPVMQLELNKADFSLQAHLVPDAVGNKAYLQTGSSTPWRSIIVSKTPEGILASNLILNLNDPAPAGDYSWITPQRFIGVWWEMHVGKGSWDLASRKHAANTDNVKKYIDFAANYGIQGVLVEGWNQGWEDWFGNWKEEVFDFVSPYPDYNLDELTTYAQSKNVRLIMHHETAGSVTNYERRLDQALDQMVLHGMNTVKTGYVGKIIPRGEHHDGQWMNRHYLHVGMKAAEKKIMVVSHESSRPTGLHRTYPNLLASEAARGNEFNNAPTFGLTPEHETILAFTRLKGGPMDYTPGFFDFKLNRFDASRKTQVNTTLAKQVALFVVFYSPIQMLGDLPENLEKYPELLRFIVDIPLDWEESTYLNAEPGDLVIVARKSKDSSTWYVAGISDEQAREVSLDFSFLEKGKRYQIQGVQDAKDAHYDHNPTGIKTLDVEVKSGDHRKVRMAEGGGFVFKIKEIN
jgi:hypothetical protein